MASSRPENSRQDATSREATVATATGVAAGAPAAVADLGTGSGVLVDAGRASIGSVRANRNGAYGIYAPGALDLGVRELAVRTARPQALALAA